MNQNHFKELEIEMSKYGIIKIHNKPDGEKVYEFYKKGCKIANHMICSLCSKKNDMHLISNYPLTPVPDVCIIKIEEHFEIRRYCTNCDKHYTVTSTETIEEAVALFVQIYKWIKEYINTLYIFIDDTYVLKYPFGKMVSLLEELK